MKNGLLILILIVLWGGAQANANLLVSIPSGRTKILYLNQGKPVAVPYFEMQENPVSIKEYLEFLKANPRWRRSNVAKSLFADEAYLKSWSDDFRPKTPNLDAPVTEISWFAARAYCESKGLRLPSVREWEFAGQADIAGVDLSQMIIEWYSRPTDAELPAIASSPKNRLGIRALHGVIWEWTEDFNSVFVTGESRGDASLDKNMFCGAGGQSGGNPSDYAAYMRFAYRSSLKAKYTVANLGFRCVKGN